MRDGADARPPGLLRRTLGRRGDPRRENRPRPNPGREKIEPSQVCVALAGYWSEDAPDWPPDYEQAKQEQLEALSTVLDALNLSEPTYDALVRVTAEIMASPHFRRLRDALARTLSDVPRLDHEDISALARASGFPIPREEAAPC